MKKEHLDNCYENVFKGKREVFGLTLPMTLIYKHLFNEASLLLERKFNLSHSEMDVLASLYFNGKIMTPTDLYEATIFSSGGMTKLLKKLENKVFISRVPSKKDRRSMLVEITKEGEVIVEKSLNVLIEKDNRLFDVLEDNEKEVLSKVLKKLVYSFISSEYRK